jgi:hypothetical protein
VVEKRLIGNAGKSGTAENQRIHKIQSCVRRDFPIPRGARNLWPGELAGWRVQISNPQYRCLSTAGARPNPRWLRSRLDQGCQLYCGFDADATGDLMAAEMLRWHPRIKRLRPSIHDWNDVLTSRT